MTDSNIKTKNPKTNLKADVFDFIIPLISFFTVYKLTELLFEEDFIFTSLVYLIFFSVTSAYIIIGKKAFHTEAIFTGCLCLITAVSLAIHGNYLSIPLLMFLSALYCLTLTKSNLHQSGSYLYCFDLFERALLTPVANLFLPLKTATRTLKALKKSGRNFGLLCGFLVALPVLAILVFLLAESDAAFESAVGSLLRLLPDFDLDLYTIIALIFTPYIVSVLFTFKYNVDGNANKSLRANIRNFRFMSAPFIGGFLGSVSLLYVVYLLSQTAYFFSAFGGKLPDTVDITLSEYARRGFFEMSAVAAINLCLIGAGAIFSKRQGEKFSKIYKVLALFLCGFTMLLITTAMSKMVLYISELGLTHKRLAVSVINVLLFLTFIFIIVRLFKKDFPYFRYICVISLTTVTAFMLVGADSVIGRYNTSAYLSGKHKEIDISLLQELNDYDELKYLDKLVDDEKYGNEAKSAIGERYLSLHDSDINYTVKHSLAVKYVSENAERFREYYTNSVKPSPTALEFLVRVTAEKGISGISIYDGFESQGFEYADGESIIYDTVDFILPPETIDKVEIITVTVTFADGSVQTAQINYHESNFYKITTDSDGALFIKPLI